MFAKDTSLVVIRDSSNLGLDAGTRCDVARVNSDGTVDIRVNDAMGIYISNVDAESQADLALYVPRMERYVWTVEIAIDPRWVADGFDLNDRRMQTILEMAMPYARSHEISCRVTSAPDADSVAIEQGYRSAADRLARTGRK